MVGRHINVGGEDSDEQRDQAPPRQRQNVVLGNQQAKTSEQLAYAAGDNRKEMKGDPGGHDGEEECGSGEMHHASEEKK